MIQINKIFYLHISSQPFCIFSICFGDMYKCSIYSNCLCLKKKSIRNTNSIASPNIELFLISFHLQRKPSSYANAWHYIYKNKSRIKYRNDWSEMPFACIIGLYHFKLYPPPKFAPKPCKTRRKIKKKINTYNPMQYHTSHSLNVNQFVLQFSYPIRWKSFEIQTSCLFSKYAENTEHFISKIHLIRYKYTYESKPKAYLERNEPFRMVFVYSVVATATPTPTLTLHIEMYKYKGSIYIPNVNTCLKPFVFASPQ